MEKANNTGRRSADKVVQLVPNPYSKGIINATQSLYLSSLDETKIGLGYFVMSGTSNYHWEMHGLALHNPELAIGIMMKINASLAGLERVKK